MHELLDEFMSYLNQQDKEKCVRFALSRIRGNTIDVTTLYNEILTPALYAVFRKPEEQAMAIWEEHVRTSIVRTIIECCFPYVIQESDEKYQPDLKGKIIVLCPPGELHEIGPRMVADFFTLFGFNVIFTGANMPHDEILNALKYVQPRYVAISITNYYNLVAAGKAVREIANLRENLRFRVILGGQACQANLAACQKMNPDMILNTFTDIQRLAEGETDAAI